MYNAMKMLIQKRHYSTKEEVIIRMDSFRNSGALSDSEYNKLFELLNDIY